MRQCPPSGLQGGSGRLRQIRLRAGTPCDGRLGCVGPRRYELHKIGIEQQRRALENQVRDVGLVACERQYQRRRRLGRGREHFRHRPPDERRRIVERHDHCAFGRQAIVRRELGIKISARQGGGGIGPFRGRGRTYPLEEMTNDQRSTVILTMAQQCLSQK